MIYEPIYLYSYDFGFENKLKVRGRGAFIYEKKKKILFIYNSDHEETRIPLENIESKDDLIKYLKDNNIKDIGDLTSTNELEYKSLFNDRNNEPQRGSGRF